MNFAPSNEEYRWDAFGFLFFFYFAGMILMVMSTFAVLCWKVIHWCLQTG